MLKDNYELTPSWFHRRLVSLSMDINFSNACRSRSAEAWRASLLIGRVEDTQERFVSLCSSLHNEVRIKFRVY